MSSLFDEPRRRDHHGGASVVRRRWSRALSALAVALVALVVGGLVSVERSLDTQWRVDVGDFRWVVLVRGDQLIIDEVGKFLNQTDDVAGVRFMSAEDSLQFFRDAGDLTDELRGLEQNPFPSAYHVTWNPDVLDTDRLNTVVQDFRTFPGVVDVAYDGRLLSAIRASRLEWFRVRTVLAAGLLLVSIAFVMILGRFLFTFPFSRFSWKPLVFHVMEDGAAWAAGVFIAYEVLGTMPGPAFFGGLLLGLLRHLHALTGDVRP